MRVKTRIYGETWGHPGLGPSPWGHLGDMLETWEHPGCHPGDTLGTPQGQGHTGWGHLGDTLEDGDVGTP